MKLGSVPHQILLLFIFSFMAGSKSAVTEVRVKLNQPATLTCERNCTAVEWSVFDKPNDVLAQCNQKSCWPKSGFNTSHDQYLRGVQTFTITAADFSKRNTYTCRCDGKDICDVRLSIDPLISLVHLNQFNSQVMDVHITEPVKLIYSRDSAGVSAEDICWMENAGELQCRDDYKHRVSFHHTSITLRGVKPADSGVYTIQDMKNKDLHIYSVTVVFPVWAIILILLLVVLLVLYVLPLIVGVWILRKCVDLRKKILQLLWFPVKQVKDDVVRNTVLLAAAPLYSALVLWMEYKNLKKKYLQYKNHSEGFDVYFKLQENNEDGISDIKSDEQKQQVLFYLLVDLNDYVDQFRSAEESGESYTEAWKNIEHVNGLLQVLNNTSLSQENHTV